MKLSDFINESNEPTEDVLFEEVEITEAFSGKRYLGKDFQSDLSKFSSKTGLKGSNPFRALMNKYKNPVGKTEPTEMVRGMSNAKELLGRLSDYKTQSETLAKKADEFDKFVSDHKTKIGRTTDDDKTAHQKNQKAARDGLNSFYSSFKHLSKQLPKAHEKARTFNRDLAAAKSKNEIKGNAERSKAASKARTEKKVNDFKDNVRTKTAAIKKAVKDDVKSSTGKAKEYGSAFKNKAKELAQGVKFKMGKS